MRGALRLRDHQLRVRRERKQRRAPFTISAVAKIEAADPPVSIDLLARPLLALGVTRKDLAKVVAPPTPRVAA